MGLALLPGLRRVARAAVLGLAVPPLSEPARQAGPARPRVIVSGAMAPSPGPKRAVHHTDAIEWLRGAGRLQGASVVTSLPDVSEVGGLGLDGWREWFVAAAALTMESVPDEGVAIFFQSDIRKAGVWIDKGALVSRGAERAGHVLLFHKIVCRLPPGTVTFGRASYAHMLGYARTPRPKLASASADVLPDGGFKPGSKAMGVNACLDACRFVIAETPTRTIVDPFCGFGTVLAVANALGLDAIGVDHSVRMCRRARTLQVEVGTGAR